KAVASLSKGQLAADSTVSSADHALEADKAAKEAERLVTQIRDAISVLVPAEKHLRQEINALHSAVPEAVLAGIQDRFNELHGLLSSYAKYPPLVRYDDQALASAREANLEKGRALQM